MKFRLLSIICALAAVLAQTPQVSEGQVRTRSTYNGGRFVFNYVPPKNKFYIRTYDSFKTTRALEEIASALDRFFMLPRDIPVTMLECGQSTAFYSIEHQGIVICYEFYHDVEEAFLKLLDGKRSRENLEKVMQRNFDTVTFVLFHEIGHALIHQLDLPVTGKEEDAVDQLAAILLLQDTFGSVMVSSVAMHFSFLASQTSNKANSITALPFWNEHSLDAQRMYDITCLIYGSDPQRFVKLVGQDALPAERAQRCPLDYKKKYSAWNRILRPFIRPRR